MIRIQENFIKDEDFAVIAGFAQSKEFPWFYHNSVSTSEDNAVGSYFHRHSLFENCSKRSDFFNPIMEPILIKLNPRALIKATVNMYPRTHEILTHESHVDQTFECKVLVLYVNTCDGFTLFTEDNRKVKSVANKVSIFDSSHSHSSTTCTDQDVRILININYL